MDGCRDLVLRRAYLQLSARLDEACSLHRHGAAEGRDHGQVSAGPTHACCCCVALCSLLRRDGTHTTPSHSHSHRAPRTPPVQPARPAPMLSLNSCAHAHHTQSALPALPLASWALASPQPAPRRPRQPRRPHAIARPPYSPSSLARPPSAHPIFEPSDALALVDIHIRFFPSSFLDAASVLLLLCSPPAPCSRLAPDTHLSPPPLPFQTIALRLRPPTVRPWLDILPVHPDSQNPPSNPTGTTTTSTSTNVEGFK